MRAARSSGAKMPSESDWWGVGWRRRESSSGMARVAAAMVSVTKARTK